MLLAVNTAEVATPLAVVIAVLAPAANVPLAPLPGAAKVTSTPLRRLPPASFTVATNGAAKAVLIVVFCGVPLVAVTDAGGPGLTMKLIAEVVLPPGPGLVAVTGTVPTRATSEAGTVTMSCVLV